MYQILLVPKNKRIAPHIWKEGGDFATKEAADFHSAQIRKMKDLYVNAQPVPKGVILFPVKNFDGKYFATYLVYKANNGYAVQFHGASNNIVLSTKKAAIEEAKKLSGLK